MRVAEIDDSTTVRLARQRMGTLRRLFHLAAGEGIGTDQVADPPPRFDRLPRKAQSPAAWSEGYSGCDKANARAGHAI